MITREKVMKEIAAKTILQRQKPSLDFWFYQDYNINLYRGCSFGCIYCDSRSECYQNDEFDIVKPKRNAIRILELEMMKKRIKGVVGMGSMSDPYNPLEARLELTRSTLELFIKYGFGMSIITKSDLILRDLDLLKELNEKSSLIVNFTITTAADDLQKLIEPYSSPTSKRFAALKILNDNGIKAGIILDPILPFINDTEENIENIVALGKEHHINHIFGFFGVTLRDRQRDYFYRKLDEHFPGIKEKYIKRYGLNYSCVSDNAAKLKQLLREKTEGTKILIDIRKINESFLKQTEQLSLDL